MKIIHIIASLDNKMSGTSYVVTKMAAALNERKHQNMIITTRKFRLGVTEDVDQSGPQGVSIITVGRLDLRRGIMVVPRWRKALRALITNAEIVHVHGFWLYPTWSAIGVAAEWGVPVVLTPHGMLMRWSVERSKPWQKQLALSLGLRAMLGAVSHFHATSAAEASDLSRLVPKAKVSVVPNGVDLPESTPDWASRRPPYKLLFLGRLSSEKGLDLLLRAWSRIEAFRPTWELLIAGPPQEGYDRYLHALCAELGCQRVKWMGPVSARHKEKIFAEASLVVLPSYTENYGVVVAEALANAVPVITTTGTPWRDVEALGCGWCVMPREDSMCAALARATATPLEELEEMGKRGRQWMARRFAWPRVAEEMEQLYRKVV